MWPGRALTTTLIRLLGFKQGAGMERIGQYVEGWGQWVNAGVDVIVQRAEEL